MISIGDGLSFLAIGIAFAGYFIGIGLESLGKQIKKGMRSFLPAESKTEDEEEQ